MAEKSRVARRGRAGLPSITSLLEAARRDDRFAGAAARQVSDVLSVAVSEARALVGDAGEAPSMASVLDRAAVMLDSARRRMLAAVVNATGVVLHTNLGRAPLAREAIEAIAATAAGYCNLELALESGERGRRGTNIEALLRELTGCEAALVVNNNAGATLLVLAALAAGREVIVSRGQLVEIGGSYRLPEVMAAGGAVLREVGTTNKTRLSDYREAISVRTALLMRVHASNYRICGFAEAPSSAELAGLSRESGVPFYDDLGSGAIADVAEWRAAGEPNVADSVTAGADVISFSGDKLLGGPQAGIILGRADLIERIRKHPMTRALRVDKMTIAGLQATLELYRSPERAARAIPVLAMLKADIAELERRAEALASRLRAARKGDLFEVEREECFAGGGSLPAWPMATCVVRWRPADLTAAEAARELRLGATPVIARVRDGAVLFDVRSLGEADFGAIEAALGALTRNEPRFGV